MSGKTQSAQPQAEQIGTINEGFSSKTKRIVNGYNHFLALIQHRIYPLVRREGYEVNNAEIWALLTFAGYTALVGRDLIGLDRFFSTVAGSPKVHARLAGAINGLKRRGFLYTVQHHRGWELWALTQTGCDVVETHDRIVITLKEKLKKKKTVEIFTAIPKAIAA